MSYNKVATHPDFNQKLIELVKVLPDGAEILELGSGYTTRLIVDNMKSSHRLVSLEESKEWYEDIISKDKRMEKYVRHSPLVETGIGRKLFYRDVVERTLCERLLFVPKFSLVIADGPTGGHRWPNTFLIWAYLAESYTILFDDIGREQYQLGIKLWQASNFATQAEADKAVQWFDGWAMLIGKK